MNTLVEKMARAIYEHVATTEFPDGGPLPRWDDQTEATREFAVDAAFAALKALREPSIAQRHVCTFEEAEITWPRMIDAAIQEHSTTPPRNAS